MNSLISIVVPVFNAQKYIKKCIDSLLAQTYKIFEIICVNDGSQDDSLIILDNYMSQDNRIKVINKENREGVSSARNAGIANAKGEYLLFVDADDYVAVNYIESMLYEANNENIVICDVLKNGKRCSEKTCGKKIILDRKNILKGICSNTFSGFPVNKLFKREVIEQNKIKFDENIKLCEDLLFCLEYMKFIKWGVYINCPLYFYDVHAESMTAKKGYNGDLITALDAYDKIAKMEIIDSDEEIKMIVHNEYFIMCMRCLKMMKKYNKAIVGGNEMRDRFNKFKVWNVLWMKNVACKYKAFFLVNKMLLK